MKTVYASKQCIYYLNLILDGDAHYKLEDLIVDKEYMFNENGRVTTHYTLTLGNGDRVFFDHHEASDVVFVQTTNKENTTNKLKDLLCQTLERDSRYTPN